MVHATVLRTLASQALQEATVDTSTGSKVANAASRYWSKIRNDDRLPDNPFPEDFRKQAFKVWGEVSSGSGRSKGRRSRR